MRLSKHFTLSEFTKSQTATRRRIRNHPSPADIKAIKLLCEKVLEPVREHFGKPVVISSGYRSPALNRAVGGAARSQHAKGEAADFEIPGVSNVEVCRWMEKNLNYDQLILEFYTPGIANSGWVHVSYREPYRNAELTARRVRKWGRLRTEYVRGIVA
jgi:zinc D-Ala-D-Ala carboxypeptidase